MSRGQIRQFLPPSDDNRETATGHLWHTGNTSSSIVPKHTSHCTLDIIKRLLRNSARRFTSMQLLLGVKTLSIFAVILAHLSLNLWRTLHMPLPILLEPLVEPSCDRHLPHSNALPDLDRRHLIPLMYPKVIIV